MRRLTLIALGLSAALGVAGAAQAAQGCGPGLHRGPRGACRPNRPAVPPGRYVAGHYYSGHGWWDGRRWYRHRYRYHNGWRYR